MSADRATGVMRYQAIMLGGTAAGKVRAAGLTGVAEEGELLTFGMEEQVLRTE